MCTWSVSLFDKQGRSSWFSYAMQQCFSEFLSHLNPYLIGTLLACLESYLVQSGCLNLQYLNMQFSTCNSVYTLYFHIYPKFKLSDVLGIFMRFQRTPENTVTLFLHLKV